MDSWVKWYTSKWLGSETRFLLNTSERAIYLDLVFHCLEKGSIPADENALARLAAVSDGEFRKSWPRIRAKFIPIEDGRLTNPAAAEESEKRAEGKAKKGEAGRLGGLAKAQKQASKMLADARKSLDQTRSKPHSNKEEEKEKEIPLTPFSHQPVFDACAEWLRKYPKQVKLQTATAAWLLLMDSGEITADRLTEVFAGLDRWKKSEEWAKDNGKYIPAPAVFLTGNDKHHGRLWKDFPKAAADEEDMGWVRPADWSKDE